MNKKRSMLMLIGSMVIFGTIGIFRRNIPLSSAALSCVRGIVGTLFLLTVSVMGKRLPQKPLKPNQVLGLIITGAMIGLNWILLFEAYNYTTVPIATLCYYMQPVIVMITAPLIFRDRFTQKKLICCITAIIGMFLISGMAGGVTVTGADNFKGIMLGLGAAALYAAVILINKTLPGIDAYQKTIMQLGSAGVVVLPYVLLTEDISAINLGAKSLILVLVVGFVHTGIAYMLYFGSMDGLKAQSISMMSYIDPVVALVLSALILGESLTVTGIIGAIMILGAALASETS